MEKDSGKSQSHGGGVPVGHQNNGGGGGPQKCRTTSDFGLQWGNRKRLRCMKIQVKDGSSPVHRTTVRIDRRVIRSDHKNQNSSSVVTFSKNLGLAPSTATGSVYFNLRQRPTSPSPSAQPSSTSASNGHAYFNLRQRAPTPPPPQRVLRNSEAMKGPINGLVEGFASSHKSEDHHQHHQHHQHHHRHDRKGILSGMGTAANSGAGGGSISGEAVPDNKSRGGGGGGSTSGGSDSAPSAWPPKFVIGLTNKEKEEDFMAIKGSKLPQRPKKRAKVIQRTLNLVSPGAWLCDLTLERYEVREKKISKKRPRGLKAMNNMDSDSE